MKNRNRVRKNSSPTAAASQCKTNAPNKKAPASRQVAETVTCVWVLPDGSEFARVEFPGDLFARIKRAATKLDVTLQEFFENAILNFIELRKDRRAA